MSRSGWRRVGGRAETGGAGGGRGAPRRTRALAVLAFLAVGARAHAEPATPAARTTSAAQGGGGDGGSGRGARPARKVRRLEPTELASAIGSALADKPLPRGATLSAVRARAILAPIGFARAAVDLPTLPRRAGPVTVQAVVSLLDAGGALLDKTVVPVDLSLPPEAAFAEIPRGAPMVLVVRRGRVEVTVTAVAAVDADVGAVLPVTIKPSGRVIRARAVDKDHAVAVEGS